MCISQGDLHAYLDDELSILELETIALHLAKCERCRSERDLIAARMLRLTPLLESLASENGPANIDVALVRLQTQTIPSRPRWALAAVMAAAAAVALLVIVTRRTPEPQRTEVVSVNRQERAPAPMAVTTPEMTSTPVTTLRTRGKRKVRRNTVPEPVYYLPLDDDPIQMGMVVRVILPSTTGEVKADLVLGEDGRARAIRFVH